MRKLLLWLCLPMCVSCELLGIYGADDVVSDSALRIAFAPGVYTRSGAEVPDTSDFILTVADASGEVVYHGAYGDSPETIMVRPGSYTVRAVSEEFDKPMFSKPQYGDELCIVVPQGGVADVRLSCRQVNCGIKLVIDPVFLTRCPDGVLFLRSAQGSLMYSYNEKRIAYFNPGDISLILNRAGKDDVLMTRKMSQQQVLVLGVSVAENSEGFKAQENISIAVDTTRNWIAEDYVIGEGGGKGTDPSNALTVSQAISSVGSSNVWVSGHIVGGDLTSSSASFEGPFTSKTCILLGSRSSVDSRSSCIAVQLPSGAVRNALNLVDNPDLLGRKVLIKGNIEASYYGMTGLKGCSDYKL